MSYYYVGDMIVRKLPESGSIISVYRTYTPVTSSLNMNWSDLTRRSDQFIVLVSINQTIFVVYS